MRWWVPVVAYCLLNIANQTAVRAQILNWQTSTVIPGTENVVPGPGLQLSGQQLSYAQLLATDLTGSDFSASNLGFAQFNGSQLVNVNLSNSNLSSAYLVGANLTDARIEGANLSFVTPGLAPEQFYATRSYKEKTLSRIIMSYDDLSNWSFAGQNLNDSFFERSTMKNVDFSGANLAHAKFFKSDLSAANFKDALFVANNPRNVAQTFEETNLTGANFSNVDLSGISFRSANLTNANLSNAIINHATFQFSDLSFAQLSTTASFKNKNLLGVRLFDGIDLSNKDLRGFNFINATLQNAIFTGANLSGSQIQGANFLNAPLSPEQLYSTQSYQSKNLSGITVSQDLNDFNFQGQDLSNSTITSVNLTGANFTDAIVTGMTLLTPISKAQLYATRSYKSNDLRGVRFWPSVDLKGADFSNQNLSGAFFFAEGMTNVNLTNAIIKDARFSLKLTSNQLYSTKSYQDKNLRGVYFTAQNLKGWSFASQDLRDASFEDSQLDQADFSNAEVTDTFFGRTNLTKEQLYSTKSYQDHNLKGVYFPLLHEAWNLAGQDLRLAEIYDVKGSDLRGANLSSANLTSTDLQTAIVNADTIYDQWTFFGNGFDPVAAGMTFVETAEGDFNANSQFDLEDLLGLQNWLRNDSSISYSPRWWLPKQAYDINDDDSVDSIDLEIWVHDLKQTSFGDANLDGTFNSTDLVEVFAAGEYQDSYGGNSNWSTGDWNLDGDFDSTDLVLAFQDGGYEQPAAARSGNVSAVPEPGTLGWIAATGLILYRRRARR